MRSLLTFLVVLGFAGLLATREADAAELACDERVLTDWFDNGRVDRLYPLPCYEEAISAMPTDLRDYTDARDVIRRALASALREQTGETTTAPDQAPQAQAADGIDTSRGAELSVPLPLLVLFALALTVLGISVVRRLDRPRGKQ